MRCSTTRWRRRTLPIDGSAGARDSGRPAPASGTVVAIDGDVFLGEIAGQHAVAALAEAERDLDLDLRLLHRRRDFRLVVGRIARAAVCDANAVEGDRELRA